MFTILNRIFCIPEIEELIFDYLDPVIDLKNIAAINHHYHNLIDHNKGYTEIRNFCKSQKECNLTTFVNACKQGNICAVKYIYTKKNISHEELTKALRFSCYRNHLEIAIWLYNSSKRFCPSLDLSESYLKNEYVFELCCEYGHLEIIIWLYNLSGFFDNHIDYYSSFEKSCFNGHLEVAQWLYNLSNSIDIHINNE